MVKVKRREALTAEMRLASEGSCGVGESRTRCGRCDEVAAPATSIVAIDIESDAASSNGVHRRFLAIVRG